MSGTGPLRGLRVVEMAGIGPAPHAGMVLADLGADIVRIERPSGSLQVGDPDALDPLLRGRSRVLADLRNDADRQIVSDLISRAQVLLEGFRPGVMERLGLGPQECLAANPQLVYARVTGWGQQGPMSARAGHDINYISLTGVLHAIGRAGGPPVPPLNLVGDFGGGSMLVVIGILAALREADQTGSGQVIDAAMVDGASLLNQMALGFLGQGAWVDQPDSNLLDGHAPFYDTYVCADGGFVAVGALEPQFYAQLIKGLGLNLDDLPEQHDRAGWPVLRERFATAFRSRGRDEWAQHFADTDACVTPVLSMTEARENDHMRSRATIVDHDGLPQAAPAPRFSRHALGVPKNDQQIGAVADLAQRWM